MASILTVQTRANLPEKLPGLVEYRGSSKGEIKAKTVTEKKVQTLEDKIAARDYRANEDKKKDEESAQITIGGIQYIVRSEDASPDRIRKVGDLADEIYKETQKNNPYIASLKTAIMSLFERGKRQASYYFKGRRTMP